MRTAKTGPQNNPVGHCAAEHSNTRELASSCGRAGRGAERTAAPRRRAPAVPSVCCQPCGHECMLQQRPAFLLWNSTAVDSAFNKYLHGDKLKKKKKKEAAINLPPSGNVICLREMLLRARGAALRGYSSIKLSSKQCLEDIDSKPTCG